MDFATKMENDTWENSYVDPSAGKVSVRRYAADWLALKPMAADVEELYALWRRQGAMPNTMDSRRIALSGMFSHVVRHKRIRENPVKQAEQPANPIMQVDERALPSFDEISALAKEFGPRLEPAVWLMADCVSESRWESFQRTSSTARCVAGGRLCVSRIPQVSTLPSTLP
ncbi:hypothetical protein OG863_33285 [Streptomyces decoyicus]|uniref:Core-binding (CB) domain-containing protein n=1 Tax=Streptomyces decoyicus TaxID=249567 RepID=A0ABZ1FR05_9ACTN|nr:hypothetical protein [Streptomyces decoyicus]WSB72438.1 hypothetical protein OG863_33285 [Streptomyces decoyicus]